MSLTAAVPFHAGTGRRNCLSTTDLPFVFPLPFFAPNVGGFFSLDTMQSFTTYFYPKKGYQPLFVRLVTPLLAGDSICYRVDAGFSREGRWLRNRNEIRNRGVLVKSPVQCM